MTDRPKPCTLHLKDGAEVTRLPDGWWSFRRNGEHIRHLGQFESELIRAALASSQSDADLERRTGEPHIDGWPLVSGLPAALASTEYPKSPAAEMCNLPDKICTGKCVYICHHEPRAAPTAPAEPSRKCGRLVPGEPTLKMIHHGAQAARDYAELHGGNSPAVIYRAMLAAAPQVEPQQQLTDKQIADTTAEIFPVDFRTQNGYDCAVARAAIAEFCRVNCIGAAPQAAPTALAEPSLHVTTRSDNEDEDITLFVNGIEVARATYDEHGSEGMRLMRDVATGLAAAPQAEPQPLTSAARDVLAERRRQIEAEGWAPEHDDRYTDGEMALAASCYACAGANLDDAARDWPWDIAWFKPTSLRRNLIKAAALLLAEIERLDRAGTAPKGDA